MAYEMLDFLDLQDAIMEELKLQSSDTVSRNRIKRMINTMYMQEVIPAARWWWLYGNTAVTHKNYYAGGTVSVTPNVSTVTLSVAPAATDGDSGSFNGWLFSVDGKNEVYRITAHTALSTTVTLDRPFNTELNAAANYKIWNDLIPLPTDLRETTEVWHDHQRAPMEAKGRQDMRRLESGNPKAEGRPVFYTTDNFTGTDESDRYRQLRVYPSISQYKTLIKVDYVKEATPLNLDGDEPLMPLEDRIVLFYGALSLAWGSIGRNPEEAARNRMLFDNKLARMMGKIQDTQDKPRIEPDSLYIRAKRGPRIFGTTRSGSGVGSGSSSYTAPTYLENVTINGAVITGNATVASGITIDGRDISADGADLDDHIAATGDVHGIGATADVVGTDTAQTLTNKNIDASANSISGIANVNIASDAAIARSKLAAGTAYATLVNDASGVASEVALSANDLVLTDANGTPSDAGLSSENISGLYQQGLKTTTLTDATTGGTAATFNQNHVTFYYYVSRGGTNVESGWINAITDGTNVAQTNYGVTSLGTTGVTLTMALSGTDLVLTYDTTSTGTDASLRLQYTELPL